MRKYSQKISQLINVAGKINNFCIYDVEFKPPFLRVYIDNETNSVDLNACEKFIRSLMFLFQSEGIKNMECEVSSPGLERKLKKDWHFLSSIGKIVRIQTSQPVFCYDKKLEKKRQKTILSGQLLKYEDNAIRINDGFLDWIIPLDIITKAHVVFKDKNQA